MTFYRRLFFMLPAMALLVVSCTKPVLIGSDFLEDEKASIGFKEDFDLSFFTERSDSVVVHSDNVSLQLSNYLVGNISDPVFGNYKAEIFAQPVLSTSSKLLKGATLDSVVLQLNYDTLGNYGTLTEPVKLEVYRMRENPEFNTEYYSDQRFATDPTPLGSLTFVPKPFDSVAIGTSKIAPSIRIRLSTSELGDFLVQDTSIFENQELFAEFFNGINIRMTEGSNTMLGFRLLNGTVSVLTFYYDNGTRLDQQSRFVFTTGFVKTVYMEHDYTGSVVEPYLNPEEESDYWFIQGLAGVTTKLVIEDLSSIGSAIINQADLEVYGTYLNIDNPDLYPAIEYLVTQEQSDSIIVNSIDVLQGLARAQGNNLNPVFDFYYGGKIEQIVPGPQAIFKYSMKVTAQVKDIFLGKKENIIYFNPFEKANVPNRSVMFGPGHPDYAPKLRIYYTSL